MNPTEATERIEELEKAFEKLEITAEAGASREAALRSTIAELQRENVALREKVDDWENAVAHALEHRSEEQHCTCVPPLLGKVKQLERDNAALEKLIIKAGYIITNFDGEMALCRDPWHQPKEEQP
jgi:plasmid stabilization system protein ParE